MPWIQTVKVQKVENICKVCNTSLPLSDLENMPIIRCPYCGAFNNNPKVIEVDPNFDKIPDIKLRWVRFQERICFSTKCLLFLALGIKGAGKSSLLEVLAVRYSKIIDLYGSSDMESLSWCKPEFAKVWRTIHGCEPNILLVTGKTKEVSCRWDTCHIADLTLKLIEEHDVITTVEPFFAQEGEYYEALAKIVNILWKQRLFWKEPWYVLIREASNWLYSRSKVVKDDNFAKAEFLKAMREARHHGISVGADMLRWTSLDKEIRDLSDYVLIKNLGAVGLPQDLRWLYRYFKPYPMMQMKPNTFILSSAKGSVGFGVSDYPIWHKPEHENILKLCGIEIKGIESEVPDDRSYNAGAFEHHEIIQTYMETKSMPQTATNTARSYKTVWNHLADHNSAISHLGECKKCYNAKGGFSKILIQVPKAGRPKKEKVK